MTSPLLHQDFDVVVMASTMPGASPGPARLAVGAELELRSPRDTLRLPGEAISSCAVHGEVLSLVAGSWGLVELRSGEATALAGAVANRVCTLPEVTRALRSLGRPEGGSREEQDLFFRSFLDARRRAEVAPDVAARMRAFDGEALAGSVRGQIAAMARARHPRSAPHQRALEAQLLELADPLLATLQALGKPGVAGDLVAAWREWSDTVRRLFEEADRCWWLVRRRCEGEVPG